MNNCFKTTPTKKSVFEIHPIISLKLVAVFFLFHLLLIHFSIANTNDNSLLNANLNQRCNNTNNSIELALSFGQSITREIYSEVTENTEWIIQRNENVLKTGEGLALYDFIFSDPGQYEVFLIVKHSHSETGCNHADEYVNIAFKVSPIAAELVYDSSFWHQILSTKKSFAGDTLLLPIRVRYYGEAMPIQNLQISLAGVNCTLKGIQNGEVVLPPNETTLVPFVLYGNVGSGIFAMLDFIDQNGNTATNSITQIIK